MYFKPKIFISSLLKGKIDLRQKLKKCLVECGADVLTYEKELTPSCTPYTYRKDILEADFVIFILDDKYGSKTNSGLSGSEEEYKICVENKIKTHIYLKATKSKNKSQNEFLNKIKDAGVSYFIYKDENDLFIKIKESVFTMAREICINKIHYQDFDQTTNLKISFEHDYAIVIELFKLFGDFCKRINEGCNIFSTNVCAVYFESFCVFIKSCEYYFNDFKLQDMVVSAFNVMEKLIDMHSRDYCSTDTSFDISIPIYGKTTIVKSSPTVSAYGREDEHTKCLISFQQKMNKIKQYVTTRKIYIDSLI